MKSLRGSRFSQVGCVAMLSASLWLGVSAGVAGAVASPTVTAGAAGQPAVVNLATTLFPQPDVGYQASEFYLTGNASSYHDVPSHAAATITNVAVTSNVATITTSAPHGLAVRDLITITGLTNTTLNVSQTAVASVPSTTTFTFAIARPDIASVADSGSETPNLTADGAWTVAADSTQQPFKTRIQVYRPTNPAIFNGTVYVEWLNVSNQSDAAAEWILAHDEMIRTGAVYVGVTAQAIGVTAARNSEPARYGAAGANLLHPGDSFSYDIFSQAGQAIRDNQPTILGGLTLDKVIAIGESQSANRMASYVDALGTVDDEYDGYFVHSRIFTEFDFGIGGPLRQSPLRAVPVPSNVLIRTDMGVPVFTFQTESDSRTIRQPDTDVFRDWEIAGSTHADRYTLGLIGLNDEGTDNTAAVALFQAMLHPTNDPFPGILPPCDLPVNAGPDHWTTQAGLHALREWVTNGTLPAASLYQQTVGGAPSADVVLDANGNVQGGVRSPHVDVPVATIRGVGQTGNSFCLLFGTDTPFSASQLATMYNYSHSQFATAWNQSVDNLVASGYLLSADAPLLKDSAESSDVGRSPLSVRADDQTITLGTPDPAFAATITGFLNSDTAVALATPPTCTVSVPHTDVGTYAITCSGGVDDKYSFAYLPGTLTVVQTACVSVPRAGCQPPQRTAVISLNAAARRMGWRWSGSSTPVSLSQFGAPVTGSTAYHLCVYDTSGGPPFLAFGATVPAGGTCGARPCWKQTHNRFSYTDAAATPDGVGRMTMQVGNTGAYIAVGGRGSNLHVPASGDGVFLLREFPEVVVQLQRSDSAACWESVFRTPAIRNTRWTFRDTIH